MLYAALYTSNSGVRAAATYLDVVGNNVANLSTTGYKTARVDFQDVFYTLPDGGAAGPGRAPPPDGRQLGFGTLVDAVTGVFTQGPLTATGRPLDLAVDGNGFLPVVLPDGTVAYTRAGNLNVDALGQLVTTDGFLVAPGLTVPAGATRVSVSPGGAVTADTPTGARAVGQLSLTRFVNPAGLLRVGDTLFVPTGAEGVATTGDPGTNGLGALAQGFLEDSNVDLASELTNLIIAQRAFGFNARAVQAENEALAVTAQLTPDTNAGT